MTKCEPSMFHCHRRAAGGGFLSLLLAVLMIAVVAEMRSRWQSRAAAAAFPDLLSRQAALKPPDSLSFSLCETCEKFNLIWAVWPGVYLVKLMACSCDLKGIGVFSSSEIKDANELLGTFGADPGQENIFCCGYSLSLLLLYKKTKHTQQKNSFSGVSYQVGWERALKIRALPPVFSPFIFRDGEWKTNAPDGFVFVASSLTGWVAVVNTRNIKYGWLTLV